MQWFDVDRRGLSKILNERGYQFVAYELVQNSLDEASSQILFETEWSRGKATIQVTDDNPDGFADLRHAWTLFAESPKKSDPLKRGRFDLGEKLVLACCDRAWITTTTGTVLFDDKGRRLNRRACTDVGSMFRGVIKMLKREWLAMCDAVARIIPPPDKTIHLNGVPIERPQTVREIEVKALQTVISDDEGRLKRTHRNTTLSLHHRRDDEEAQLYEMGIPVCPLTDGMPWHINVGQRVPLGLDRTSVPGEFLRRLRVAVLNASFQDLKTAEDANQEWVRQAAQEGQAMCQAIHQVLDLRFGPKRAAYDPSDKEANSIFQSRGGVIVYGGQLSKEEWAQAKRANAIVPAGVLTPSPKVLSSADGDEDTYPEHRVTEAMRAVVGRSALIARELLGKDVRVRLAERRNERCVAWYGAGVLTYNVGRLGKRWFEDNQNPLSEEFLKLLLHELAHDFAEDHLSHDFAEAGFLLGARLALLVKQKPFLFSQET